MQYQSPPRRVARGGVLVLLVAALALTMAGVLFVDAPFPTTTAAFTDTPPQPDNTFTTAYWDDLAAVADSHVNQQSANTNYGTQTTLEVRSWIQGSGRNERLLASFDLTPIPANNEVLQAVLRLCATAVPGSTRTYEARRVNGAWTEGGVTWNNQPAALGTVSDTAATPPAAQCMTWNVLGDVRAWVAGVANDGLRIGDSLEDDSNHLATFRSREDTAVPADQPSLYVVYRPCTDSTAPGAPTGLAAGPADTQVGLDWDDNGELDLAGYNVYRSTTQGGPYSKINGSLVATSAYTDTGLTNGTTYYYVVSALDGCANESGNSGEVSATPVAGPPAPPTGLVATPGNTEVSLDWDDNVEPNLAGYNVYRSTTQGGPYSKVNGPLVTASNYLDTGLTNGTTYYYVVRAENTVPLESGNSNEASATPVDAPPGAPTNLAATPFNQQVDLDWDDNAEPDLDGYNVYRSTTQGGPYTKVNGPLVTVSSYSDTGLTNGTTYYYVVRAVDTAANESGNSNEASATPAPTPPAAPTGLVATAGDKAVSLNWNDNAEPDLAGYNVYRSTAQGGPYTKINGSLVTTSNYNDTGLTGGVTYYYVVRAENTSTQESGDSNEASAIPYSILIAAADAYVQQKTPSVNNGGATTLSVKSKSGQAERTFVRFDVSSIPSGSTVTSAVLTLCATGVSGGRTYDVHRVTASWAENTVTWSNQPGVAASPTASITTPGSPACMSWTVTSDVQAWVSGAANDGWRVSDRVETANNVTTYRSREDTAVPADRPNLRVDWIAP